jgi:MFS family permease
MVMRLSTSPTVSNVFRNTKLVIYSIPKLNRKANVEQFLTLAQNIGLLFGAVFWGFGCDIFGRRWAFNLTIGITAVFGMIAASSPNFAAIDVFAALWSRVFARNASVLAYHLINRLGIGSSLRNTRCLAATWQPDMPVD